MSYTADDMTFLLTDAYYKSKDGNIYKLFQVVEEQFQDISKAQDTIRLYRSIDEAKGETLDYIGSNYNQERGQATDEIYRAMIKAKISRMWCSGDYNSIISALATTLQSDVSEFEFIDDSEEGTNGVVSIVGVPIERLNELGMSIGQFTSIVKSLMPVGVRVESVSYEGTFSFASGEEIEIDNNAGFADDEQTVGGYLGALASGNDYDLSL